MPTGIIDFMLFGCLELGVGSWEGERRKLDIEAIFLNIISRPQRYQRASTMAHQVQGVLNKGSTDPQRGPS